MGFVRFKTLGFVLKLLKAIANTLRIDSTFTGGRDILYKFNFECEVLENCYNMIAELSRSYLFDYHEDSCETHNVTVASTLRCDPELIEHPWTCLC